MIINPVSSGILICLIFHLLLMTVLSAISTIFKIDSFIIRLLPKFEKFLYITTFFIYSLLFTASSFLMYNFKGSEGIQIINLSFSFVLLLEVCLKIAKSEKFINWIGESLEEWLRVFIMFIVSLNCSYFFSRFTYHLLDSQGL